MVDSRVAVRMRRRTEEDDKSCLGGGLLEEGCVGGVGKDGRRD